MADAMRKMYVNNYLHTLLKSGAIAAPPHPRVLERGDFVDFDSAGQSRHAQGP